MKQFDRDHGVFCDFLSIKTMMRKNEATGEIHVEYLLADESLLYSAIEAISLSFFVAKKYFKRTTWTTTLEIGFT